ncbi:MAG: hypothetical protein OEM67_09510 [Thermoleophilia bacterium]|nr:hypothetical protein [Thermoleophilia bacterium]MDH3724922.1 hypothetical protein [Thermoleophilia bacterium]
MNNAERDESAWSEALAAELREVEKAALGLVSRGVIGVRAVEPIPGRRWYLCAFDGPAFLCVRRDLAPESRTAQVREVAAGSLLVERAEAIVDAAELKYLAGAAGRLLAAAGDPDDLEESIQLVAHRALQLAAWRESVQREVASVAALDSAVSLHESFAKAYGAFVALSQPLVERQDELEPNVISSLRVFEKAAGRAGVGEPLASRLGATIGDCDEGATQVVVAHLLPLS